MTHAYQENNLSALERTVSIQSWLLVGTKVVLCKKPYHSAMCFGKPLFSSTGKSWLVQWWEYLCPRARACRHHGRLRVPVLAGDRRTWRRSTQNKRRWRKCLFIRFAGAKAHCNTLVHSRICKHCMFPFLQIWQPLISYFGFFYPKKVELNCWAHFTELVGSTPRWSKRSTAASWASAAATCSWMEIWWIWPWTEFSRSYQWRWIFLYIYICALYTMVK